MDGYKKLIRNQSSRMKILKYLEWVPDSVMVKIQYRIKMGRKLPLKNPSRYTEKIQWYKVYYHNPLMIECVDKYKVRDFINRLGIYNHVGALNVFSYKGREELDSEKIISNSPYLNACSIKDFPDIGQWHFEPHTSWKGHIEK